MTEYLRTAYVCGHACAMLKLVPGLRTVTKEVRATVEAAAVANSHETAMVMRPVIGRIKQLADALSELVDICEGPA